ncbi:hypothetical protein PIB30_085917, partial [Stylosanthes scabra]|nr:hypothetical protein [Stylosanthes scabra]
MRGEEVRAEDIIADNMAVIAQGLQSKGNLAFPSTIYKLCKDAGVPLRKFKRTSKIPEESYITAKRMESTRFLEICHNKNKKMMMKMNQCLKREEAIMKKRSSSHNTKTNSHHNKLFQISSHNMKANTMRPSKEKLQKGSLQIKKQNLAANQSRVPCICVEEHAYACCSNPTH